jgi:peroxiredoxin
MRKVAIGLLFGVTGLLLLAQAPDARMAQKKAVMAKKREGRLKVGDRAVDFELRLAKSSETLRLSTFEGKKAVALVFGSYT